MFAIINGVNQLALIRGGSPFGELRGSIGDYTFSRNRAGAIIKQRYSNSFNMAQSTLYINTPDFNFDYQTAFVDVPDFVITLKANKKYLWKSLFYFTSSLAGSSIQYKFVITSGSILNQLGRIMRGSSSVTYRSTANINLTDTVGQPVGTSNAWMEQLTQLEVGATDCIIKMQVRVTDITYPMILKANSFIELVEFT